MKELILAGNILLWSFIGQMFLPWWIIAVICFIVCYVLKPSKLYGFTVSFLSIFILWIIKAYVADTNFDESMSGLLGALIGNISGTLVFLFTGLIGGLIGGLGGLLGSWTYHLFYHQKEQA